MARRLKLNVRTDHKQKVWNPDKVMAEALAERAYFLDTNPKYKPYQQEINRLLDKAGSPENRMTILAVLMEAKLIELHTQLKRLNTILIKTRDSQIEGLQP